MNGERKHIFDDPRSVRRLLIVFGISCVLLLLLDLADYWKLWSFKDHVHYPVESVPSFYGAYGFIGCVLLVLAAKILRKIVMRREDYYDQ